MRQNLAAVRAWAVQQPPPDIPTAPTFEVPEVEMTRLMEIAKERRKTVMTKPPDLQELEVMQLADENGPLKVVKPEIPVCGIMYNGIPLHPPGKSQSKGFVSVARHFGQAASFDNHLRLVTPHVNWDVLEECLKEMPIYTSGTKEGFCIRMRKQMGRKCIRPHDAGIQRTTFVKWLNHLMPYKPNKLVDWNLDPLELVRKIETSAVASAGPPYWRPKGDVIDEVVECVLPKVLDAFQGSSLEELQKTQPELFVVEVKNKVDRYLKPYEKTRPYVSTPFHWSALFSVLSQSYTEALSTVADTPQSANAYGLSWANGGAMKLLEKVRKLEEGQMTFYAYGDDIDVWFKRGGKFYRVCPDFVQMDGSVDAQTIQWTIEYVISLHAKKHGEERLNFWKSVGKVWHYMATNPEMLIDGTTVFRKKADDGLMTGVVGTTLFDTVKSIIAYKAFQEFVALRGTDILMNETRVAEYFKDTHGLEIKAGTWTVEEAQLEPKEGAFLTTQKFLGVLLKWFKHGEHLVLAPTNITKDWLTYYLVPRKESLDITRKNSSQITKDRYVFDMLRGQLVTGGALDPEFYSIANAIALSLDPAAIAMDVQTGGGNGEFAGSPFLKFEFPSSIFWPTREWVLDLYAPDDMKQGVEPLNFYPMEAWKEFIAPTKSRKPKQHAVVDVVNRVNEIAASVVVSGEQPQKQTPDYEPPSLLIDNVLSIKPVDCNKRSRIVDITPQGEVERPKMPTQDELVLSQMRSYLVDLTKYVSDIETKWEYFYRLKLDKPTDFYVEMARFTLENKDEIWAQIATILIYDHPYELPDGLLGSLKVHPMYPLKLLAAKLALSEQTIEKIARQHGFLVLGPEEGWKYVCAVPVALPQDTIRNQELEQIRKNIVQLRDKGTEVSVQKKVLKENVARQVSGPPAQKPVSKSGLENLPTFKPIPGFTPRVGKYRHQEWQARKILEENEIDDVTMEEEDIGEDRFGRPITTVSVYRGDRSLVFRATGLARTVRYRFYHAIARKYSDDEAQSLAVDWVDELVLKENLDNGPTAIKVGPPLPPPVSDRVGGLLTPILVDSKPFCYKYRFNKQAYLLIGQRGGFYGFSQHQDGTLSGPTSAGIQTFSLRNRSKTTAAFITGLAKALNQPVSVGPALSPTQIENYYPQDVPLLKELKETFKLDYEFPSRDQASEGPSSETQQSKGRNTSPIVSLKTLPQKEKSQQRERKEESIHSDGRRQQSNSFGRKRFFKQRTFQNDRRGGTNDRHFQSKPDRVDRNKSGKRVTAMAEVAPKNVVVRHFTLSNKNDGRPVRGGVDA